MSPIHFTMKSSYRTLVLVGSLLVTASGAFAESTTPPTPPSTPNASDNAKAIQALHDQFKAKREQFIADRKALIAKLQGATEAERKQILEQLKAEQKNRIDEQRALAKQIRDAAKEQGRHKPKG